MSSATDDVNKDRFDEAGSVRSWLIGIARNLLYEHIRRMKRRREVAWTEMCLELDELTQSQPQCCDDGVTELNGCLESLADPAREALEMRYRSNLRLAQIGNRLRRSTGAVKLLMFRARQKLRHCMDNKTGGRGDD
jgi:RNA polymerase sigma-70 factor (ECF subfamily)